MIISSSASTTLLQFIIHLVGPTKKMEKATKKRNRPNEISASYMLSSA